MSALRPRIMWSLTGHMIGKSLVFNNCLKTQRMLSKQQVHVSNWHGNAMMTRLIPTCLFYIAASKWSNLNQKSFWLFFKRWHRARSDSQQTAPSASAPFLHIHTQRMVTQMGPGSIWWFLGVVISVFGLKRYISNNHSVHGHFSAHAEYGRTAYSRVNGPWGFQAFCGKRTPFSWAPGKSPLLSPDTRSQWTSLWTDFSQQSQPPDI